MGTTAQKLQAIVDSKAAIKAAIEAKGVSDVGDVLSDYADKIEAIPSGGGEDSLTTPFYIEHMLSDESFWGDSEVTVALGKTSSAPSCEFQTSWDNETWTDWDYLNETKTLDVAEKGGHTRLYVRAKTTNTTLGASSANHTFTFTSNADQVGVAIGGNIMSLLWATGFAEQTILPGDYTFRNMFYSDTKLFSSEKLVLPATTLASNCYERLFYGCTNHKRTFAELPALGATPYCYDTMFYGNTELENLPVVMAYSTSGVHWMRSFAQGCQKVKSVTVNCVSPGDGGNNGELGQAFYNCTSLETAYFPNLRIVGTNAMKSAFYGCTSLTTVSMPKLESVGSNGFNQTFMGCTSLATVSMPKLSTANSSNGMDNAFNGCTSLATVDFSQATAVPALSNINAFGNTNQTYKILVPLALNTAWVASTNWSDESIAPHITAVGGANSIIFSAQASGSTVSLDAVGESAPTLDIEVSTDGGTSFVAYTVGTTITLTNFGDTVMFRAGSTGQNALAVDASNYHKFTMTGSLYLVGDISYLLNQSGVSASTALADYAFTGLFKDCAALVNAPELPWTTMGEGCYAHMFEGCNSLRTAPELPATTLDDYCYGDMFKGCLSLKTAPELPATTLATGCYNGMFYNAANLNSIKIKWWGLFPEASSFTNWVYGVEPTGTFDWAGQDTTTGPSAIPGGWEVVNTEIPLTFTAKEAGSTVKLEQKKYGAATGSWPTVALDFSINNGISWLSYTIGDTITLANIGDTVQFRATNTNGAFCAHVSSGWGPQGNQADLAHTFTLTGMFDLSGHIDSMRNPDWTQAGDAPNYTYCRLFTGCSQIVDASGLVIDATTGSLASYAYMFYGCTGLTNGPEIMTTNSVAASGMIPGTYGYMFNGCSSLTELKTHFDGQFNTGFTAWVNGVAASGTFYYNGYDYTTGTAAIPTGWTVASF